MTANWTRQKRFRQFGLIVLCLLIGLGTVHPVYAAPPGVPTVTTGQETITISNYTSGATLKVYRADGGSPVWQEANVITATKTIALLPYPNSYYVTQTVAGEESTNTPFFNTTLRTPVATAGIRSIDVTNVSGNTTLELHRVSNGSLVSTTVSNQGGGVYRFENVIPDSSLYYIVQSYGGQTSTNTPFLTSKLNTPVATGGTEYVDVTNVDTDIGSVLTLYDSDGVLSSNSLTNLGNGTYRFANVPPASGYYVTQTLNGMQASSNVVTVSPDLPAAPVIAAADESLNVSGIVPGAKLKLYTTTGAPVREVPGVTSATYTLENVLPNTIGYYVTQTVNNKESVNSNFANPTLHIPAAAAGVGHIDVSNATEGATLHLYDASNSQLVSSAPVDQGGGVYRFENVVPRSGYYYVTQSLGGRESLNTPFVNALLPTPVLTGGIRYADVSDVYPGAAITLYSETTPISSNPQSLGDGTYRFSDLEAGVPYYAVQSINGVLSPASNIVSVQELLPPAPQASGAEESITVSGYSPGATLKLYRADGTEIQTSVNVMGSVYAMENVLPDPQYYYVTQTVGGKESLNSEFANPTLRTPSVQAGVEYIDVGNVSSKTALTLYDAEKGTVVSQTYTMLDNGTYRFKDLAPRSGFYYVTQSANGIESVNSIFVNPVLRTPSATGGLESLDVGNVYPGAELKLFRSGQLQPLTLQAVAVGDGTYRFGNISAKGNYYVVQYVDGVASPRSNAVEVTVRSTQPPSGNDGEASSAQPPFILPSAPSAAPNGVDILVNGKLQKAGTLSESMQGDRKVQTILVDPERVRAVLDAEGTGATVTIPFAGTSDADVMIGRLSGELIREMARRKAVLVIDTPLGLYRLPAEEIPVAPSETTASANESANVRIEISIAKATDADAARIRTLAAQEGLTVLQNPVSFEISTIANEKRTTVDRFDRYVERLIPLSSGTDAGENITATVLGDNELTPIPTRVIAQNNRTYAVLSSLTNSTYALAKLDPQLADIRGNWAENAIRNMATRFVVEGTGNGRFEPSRAVTRAEFASILTKGLGLKPGIAVSSFSDVPSSSWYEGSVATAAQYGLITGFADGTFRPQQAITRAEAMVMLSRAMQLTGLATGNASGSETTLAPFSDGDSVPEWARDAAAATIRADLFNGQNGNRLAPQKQVMRAEVATLVERLLRQSGLI
ncbi:S-layer homology domain-containing protein [Saccharibacillus sacchari]|uniref:S-layer homology domain-containing protein n=1 Tax=Saccharibacillus sacchari TaxID=456493 RepID=UPI00055A5CD9|nr:S-layer homology domain-containing protein [Saccharibacillus sacchari]